MPSKAKPKATGGPVGLDALAGEALAALPIPASKVLAPPPSGPVEQPAPQPEPAAVESPVSDPVVADLATLRKAKEELRQRHPSWYPEFRDTFGHQLTEQLLPPELIALSAAELGLPPGTDPDRRRRELRALAWARSYLMAEAGEVAGLQAISQDLAYYWNDHLDGKLIPTPPIDPQDPAPWVRDLNRLRSRQTQRIDSRYAADPRYRRFVQAVKDWTDGRWRALRSAVKKVLGGETGGHDDAGARHLVQAIQSAPGDAPRLWRKEKAAEIAERLGTSRQHLFQHLEGKLGQELEQDVVSASSSSGIWHGDFIWEIEPGAQAVHAYPVSHHPSEQEWITAGRFRVLAVERLASGGVKVRVEQTGVF